MCTPRRGTIKIPVASSVFISLDEHPDWRVWELDIRIERVSLVRQELTRATIDADLDRPAQVGMRGIMSRREGEGNKACQRQRLDRICNTVLSS